MKAISIMSSRGCPYKCNFYAKAGLKYRLRNAIKVVDEIEIFKKEFKIDGINFLDLTFTANPKHVNTVCQQIINRNLSLKGQKALENSSNVHFNLL